MRRRHPVHRWSVISLFGSLLRSVPIIGSALSAKDSKKGVVAGNAAIQKGIGNATGTLNNQYNTSVGDINEQLGIGVGGIRGANERIRTDFQPYLESGAKATGARDDLAGLNGDEAQAGAIAAQKASPLYEALFGNGQDAVLGAASATGGLRGGNVQDALFKNGRETLAQVIMRQLEELGGISQQGQSAAGTVGQFDANAATGEAGLGANAEQLKAQLGANRAGNIGNLQTQSGQGNAGSVLGQTAIINGFYEGQRGVLGNALGLGGGSGGGSSGGIDIAALIKQLGGGGGVKANTSLPF